MAAVPVPANMTGAPGLHDAGAPAAGRPIPVVTRPADGLRSLTASRAAQAALDHHNFGIYNKAQLLLADAATVRLAVPAARQFDCVLLACAHAMRHGPHAALGTSRLGG